MNKKEVVSKIANQLLINAIFGSLSDEELVEFFCERIPIDSSLEEYAPALNRLKAYRINAYLEFFKKQYK